MNALHKKSSLTNDFTHCWAIPHSEPAGTSVPAFFMKMYIGLGSPYWVKRQPLKQPRPDNPRKEPLKINASELPRIIVSRFYAFLSP
jgi:hypothetical protein